tara:strand:+ start:684 stop:2033 length:1350 start_codon:yes stop_codon:yes gene_type:complete
MNKLFFISIFLLFILFNNCSFDNKTGIWGGSEEEKRRLTELEKEQKQVLDVIKVASSENIYSKNVILKKAINLSEPKKNLSWLMSGLNHQNFMGNIYLPNAQNIFLKKKIGKNKFSISKNITSPLVLENNIIFSDDTGTIFNINENGKIRWKKNIYGKRYKKIYKNLTFALNKNVIYVADNIGFIYAIDFNNGKLFWIKNHGVPLRSNIKVLNNKIFLINQDNRLFCVNTKDGAKIWDIRSISSFIKVQNFLSVAMPNEDHVIAVNSSGDLFKANINNGTIYWSLNVSNTMLAHATDFFKSSEIVIDDGNIIFSAGSSISSYNLTSGLTNWSQEVSTRGSPIVDGNNIFLVTENGYFVILEKKTGKIISSNNILKILKQRKQTTQITGFIMGSGKIYSVTLNGFLIISSASTGKVEYFRKIGDPITSNPIISDGKLFIFTENSRIIGFN